MEIMAVFIPFFHCPVPSFLFPSGVEIKESPLPCEHELFLLDLSFFLDFHHIILCFKRFFGKNMCIQEEIIQ